ncbi:MAG: MoaD/ThiS family protein [Thaumarchaeota archaeon]|nr:MoaD/ThiS family protein [Nitrososphaerota archaeon]
MPVKVYLTQMLVRHLGIEPELTAEADTVEGLLDSIDVHHQGFKDSICDESGRIRVYVNVFVNGRMLDREPKALSTRLSAGDEVHILASVAGGIRGP